MLKTTPLNQAHRDMNAKMVDFGGWDMPLHYGSQLDEHHKVRQDAGMFDVSHMLPVDIKGNNVRDFLRRLVANNVDKLTVPGKALYSCMLTPQGGIIDDLIIYFLSETWFRIVVSRLPDPRTPGSGIGATSEGGARVGPFEDGGWGSRW